MLETPDKVETVEEQLISLAGGDMEKAAVLLEAVEEKRRAQTYVKYWEPAGDQKLFWEQLTSEQKVWVILGGKQSGKSDLGTFLVTAWLLGKDYFKGELNWRWIEPLPIPALPTNVRSVGLTDTMIRDPLWLKLTASTDHPPFLPDDGSVLSKSEHTLTVLMKNGSRYAGRSAEMDPKKHGGSICDLVHIDEECNRLIWEENYQRTVRKEGKVVITATPWEDVSVSQQPWLHDLVQQAREGDKSVGVVHLSFLNNPYISDEEKRKARARWEGHPSERTILYGEFPRHSGLYYSKYKSGPPLFIPAQPIPQSSYRVLCIDPAATGYCAALWVAIDSKGNLQGYREYKEKGLTVSAHIENILTENRGDAINLFLFDPYMGRQKLPEDHRTVLQLWRDNGLPRLRAADTDYDFALQESREYVDATFDPAPAHPAVVFWDHLEKVKDEMSHYVIDSIRQGINRGTMKDRPRKHNDHLLNCFQYIAGMRLRAHEKVKIELCPPEFR